MSFNNNSVDIKDNELKKLKVNNANREKESSKSKQKVQRKIHRLDISMEELQPL